MSQPRGPARSRNSGERRGEGSEAEEEQHRGSREPRRHGRVRRAARGRPDSRSVKRLDRARRGSCCSRPRASVLLLHTCDPRLGTNGLVARENRLRGGHRRNPVRAGWFGGPNRAARLRFAGLDRGEPNRRGLDQGLRDRAGGKAGNCRRSDAGAGGARRRRAGRAFPDRTRSARGLEGNRDTNDESGRQDLLDRRGDVLREATRWESSTLPRLVAEPRLAWRRLILPALRLILRERRAGRRGPDAFQRIFAARQIDDASTDLAAIPVRLRRRVIHRHVEVSRIDISANSRYDLDHFRHVRRRVRNSSSPCRSTRRTACHRS